MTTAKYSVASTTKEAKSSLVAKEREIIAAFEERFGWMVSITFQRGTFGVTVEVTASLESVTDTKLEEALKKVVDSILGKE
ncbi:hypothetical protein [Ktedonospora formicarum]|uniref:Uncharacterized protein n=1 Tax=Ktedonospora formicarum TaxID=2778364 RepID=A0A8J3IB23_9CHLR|nr:hypothetical protein [Ktedonospora formicarum]GHO49357.1 hypothetical protein KSX_75200 [Ktedonospora formicarum]